MIRAIRERVTVKRGGVVEVRRADLPEGAEADVIVMIEEPLAEPPALGTLVGKAKGCFATASEADSSLRAEREEWDR